MSLARADGQMAVGEAGGNGFSHGNRSIHVVGTVPDMHRQVDLFESKAPGEHEQARLQGKTTRALAQSLGLAGIVELQHALPVEDFRIGTRPVAGSPVEKVGRVGMAFAV